jgi:hypothetical protein
MSVTSDKMARPSDIQFEGSMYLLSGKTWPGLA